MGMIFETTSKRAAADDALSEAHQVDDVEAAPRLRQTTKEFLQRFPEAAALSPRELEAVVDRIIVEACPETASLAAPAARQGTPVGRAHRPLPVWDDARS
jgi:hypothetical protein